MRQVNELPASQRPRKGVDCRLRALSGLGIDRRARAWEGARLHWNHYGMAGGMNDSTAQTTNLVEELRLATVWRLFGVGITAAWVVMVVSLFGQPASASKALTILVLLLVAAGLTYIAVQRRRQLAVICLLVTLVLAVTALVLLYQSPDLAYLYALPVLMAGVLVHPAWSLVVAATVNIFFTLFAPAISSGGAQWQLQPVLAVVTVGAVVVAWLLAQSFYTLVGWMYGAYLLAEQRANEAQMHRGELARALRDLDLAYYRLKRTNEALAWARWQAEEAKQAKARFVANVSHELRTPLNLIIGFSDMMATAPEDYGQPLPNSYRGDVNAIYRNAKHLSDLINDVLDLSQTDADRMPLHRETGNLCEVAEEAVRMVEGMASAKGLPVRLTCPAMPIRLSMDTTRIRQVILNLLSNAVRLTATGEITVSVAVTREEATVTVCDTGPGIPADALQRMFEEFYQVDDSLHREGGGTGLGLAISKRLVEIHGGRIWAASTPGHGSTFSFALPLVPSVESVAAARRVPTSYLGDEKRTQRILVVLNNSLGVAIMLQRRLDTYQIKVVSTLDELLEAATRLLPTALIVDAEDRDSVANAMRQAGLLRVPLISCPLPTPPQIAERVGSSDYLLKPVTREALSVALGKLSTRPSKVLIVDDDPAVVRLLARMIRSELPGVRILQAHSASVALTIIEHEGPDLMLLDLLLPGMDGLELLEQIRARPETAAMRVIIVTATELGEEAMRVGGEICLQQHQPLAAAEWLRLLQSLTAALSPVSPLPETSAPVLAAVPPA